MTFGTDFTSQKEQMESLFAAAEDLLISSQGISILGNNFAEDDTGDYLAGRFQRPTQFHFDEAWQDAGHAMPIKADALFNWVTDEGVNRGVLSTVKYDRFCIPINLRNPYGREDIFRSGNDVTNGVPLILTTQGWWGEKTLYGHSYMFRHAGTALAVPGSFELGLDGSHKNLVKLGRIFDLIRDDGTFLLSQAGFLRREEIADFADWDNVNYNWYDLYSFSLEGTYNLLGIPILYGKFDEWGIASTDGLYASTKYALNQSVPAGRGLNVDGNFFLTSLADENGRMWFANPLMGVGSPATSIDLRNDASIEIKFTDKFVALTNGMPRIAFWGANASALPANANTVPANGWCLKWSSKYDTLAIFKDGVSQGSWAITPPSTTVPFTTWIEVIQSGTTYQIYFNGTLLGSVTSTYVYTTNRAVGCFAYNRDVAAATTAAADFYLHEYHMNTFSNRVGGVREIFSDGSDTQFYYLDKFGKYCIHTIPSRVLTRVNVTNPSVDNVLVAGSTHVAIISLAGDYIEFRNKTTGALVQTINVSADPSHFGFNVVYSADESGFRVYNRGALFVGYSLYTEAGLATPVITIVETDFTGLKAALESTVASSPFNYDTTGNIRGNRYWHSHDILENRLKSSLLFLPAPENRLIAAIGQYSDGFVAVFANEDEGHTQTGKVWPISNFIEDPVPVIEQMREITIGDAVGKLAWPLETGVFNFDEVDPTKVDFNNVYRMIAYGSPSLNDAVSDDFANVIIGNNVTVTFSNLVNYTTGVVGTIQEIWRYGNMSYLLMFTTTTGASATNRAEMAMKAASVGEPKGVAPVGAVTWVKGSRLKLIKYNLRGEYGFNYMV